MAIGAEDGGVKGLHKAESRPGMVNGGLASAGTHGRGQQQPRQEQSVVSRDLHGDDCSWVLITLVWADETDP